MTAAAGSLVGHDAMALASEGRGLAVCGLDPDIESFAIEPRANGVNAIGNIADVSVAAEVRRVVDGALARLSRIDVLINNAGIWRSSGPKDDLETPPRTTPI